MKTRTKMRKQRRSLRLQRLALALAAVLATPVVVAQNLPQSGTVSSGTASIGITGNEMTITQTSQGAIIDWGSFNIATGYTVRFDQQAGNTSVTLNRDNGGSSSFINGNLSANGSVFLINPYGITFGSGAQVNVGGLVASTLNISNADFLEGLPSGHYRFTASGSAAGEVWNYGQLTASSGGTIGLIGAYIGNAGNINADAGSVVMGAAQEVTLDFFGDGLTQVTLSGNGLYKSYCSSNCAGGISSSGSIRAAGGHIEMRTTTTDGQPAGNALFVDPANGGRIWISGLVAARTVGSRQGSIVLDAGQGNIDLGGIEGQTGLVSVSGIDANESAGSIQIHANQFFTHLCVWTGGQCVNNNQLGMLDATGYGTGGNGGEIHIDANRIYHAGWLQAGAVSGNAGLIDIQTDSAELYSILTVESTGGAGGTINIDADNLLLHRGQTPWMGGAGTLYSLATLAAFGTSQGGTVNITANNLSMIDLGNVAPVDVNLDEVYRPTINVDASAGNGGSIQINTTSFSLSPWQYFEANGSGNGGTIRINADSIDLAGGLVATGGSGGGTVETTATLSLFAQASAYIKTGLWALHVPQATIVPALGAQPGFGAVLSDAALSATLDGGTRIEVLADHTLGSGGSGDIQIQPGVIIQHAAANAAAMHLAATGNIQGHGFDIEAVGGPLSLDFIANIHGDNPSGGHVSLYEGSIHTAGGDLALEADGQSMLLRDFDISTGGGAVHLVGRGAGTGIEMHHVDLVTSGGDLKVEGSSLTGAGTWIKDSVLYTNGGDIVIHGDGVAGVDLAYAIVDSAGGAVQLLGDGSFSGVYLHLTDIITAAGDMTITGSASLEQAGSYPFGVALAGSHLTSTSGDIQIMSEAAGGTGFLFWSSLDQGSGNLVFSGISTQDGDVSISSSGQRGLGLEGFSLTTGSGDITLVGHASDPDATAGVFVGSGGVQTLGGDIHITGTGGITGVWLYGGDIISQGGDIDIEGRGAEYGVEIRGNTLSSGDGEIHIVGDGDTMGVSLRYASIVSDSGGIHVTGIGGATGLLVDSDSHMASGSGWVDLEVGNAGAGDAFVLHGTITSDAGVVVRGSDTNAVIVLGEASGLSISQDELTRLQTPQLVIGSAQQAGAIRVLDAVHWDGNLTLQNEGGSGGIDLQAGINVGAHVLAMASGGDIIQTASASLTAHSLLARSSGDVRLGAASNEVAASTLAGGAGGDFQFLDGTDLAVGEVSAVGFDASAGNATALSADGVLAGGDVFLQNLSGNFTLNAGVSGSGIDLVTAGVFLNPASAGLSASTGWRVWASSWVGEQRGGLVGSGSLPNLYGCTREGGCVATSPVDGNNYFLYQQRPTALIHIDDASREYGLENPAFTFTVSGAVLGDTAAGVASGSLSTTATVGSNVGSHVIDGLFTSPAGYLLEVVPGLLTVTPATILFTADPVSRFFGFENPVFSGSFSGFRNGDTLEGVFGSTLSIYSNATLESPLGQYAILASGTALNYVIVQAPGNATALQVMPAPQLVSVVQEYISQPIENYVYVSNIDAQWLCPLGLPDENLFERGQGLDPLGQEWLKTRRRIHLDNCIDTESTPGCRF